MIDRTGILQNTGGLARFLHRVIRYGVVGIAISTMYGLGVIVLVSQLHMSSATLASILAFIGILPVAYAAHRYITFFDARPDPFQPLRFAVTTVTSFLVATAGMYVVTELTNESYLLGIAINWVLIPPTNFLIYLIWVFRAERPPLAADTSEVIARREALERGH